MKTIRNYSLLDKVCMGLDAAVRAVADNAKTTDRHYPAKDTKESKMSEADKKHSAGLMRINHAGEICAQALYHGQGFATKTESIKYKMQQSAIEEGDHLAWCKKRLTELGSHTSYLAPLWYAGSFSIGFTAGMIGDKWSLGFLAETENQVVKHLEKHINVLKTKDAKSLDILEQMQKDEAEHRDEAIKAGANKLPEPVQKLMALTSKVMVKTAYWV